MTKAAFSHYSGTCSAQVSIAQGFVSSDIPPAGGQAFSALSRVQQSADVDNVSDAHPSCTGTSTDSPKTECPGCSSVVSWEPAPFSPSSDDESATRASPQKRRSKLTMSHESKERIQRANSIERLIEVATRADAVLQRTIAAAKRACAPKVRDAQSRCSTPRASRIPVSSDRLVQSSTTHTSGLPLVQDGSAGRARRITRVMSAPLPLSSGPPPSRINARTKHRSKTSESASSSRLSSTTAERDTVRSRNVAPRQASRLDTARHPKTKTPTYDPKRPLTQRNVKGHDGNPTTKKSESRLGQRKTHPVCSTSRGAIVTDVSSGAEGRKKKGRISSHSGGRPNSAPPHRRRTQGPSSAHAHFVVAISEQSRVRYGDYKPPKKKLAEFVVVPRE